MPRTFKSRRNQPVYRASSSNPSFKRPASVSTIFSDSPLSKKSKLDGDVNSSQILGQMRKVWYGIMVRTTFLSNLAGRDDISLPLELDLEHLQQLDQYNEPSILPDSILPTVEFDEDEIESVTSGLMNPPSCTFPGIDDTSKAIPHERSYGNLSKFENGRSLTFMGTGISV